MVVLAIGSIDGDSGSGATAPPGQDKIGAWVMAQQFVEKNLKSPSTADYGSVWRGDYQSADDVVTPLGNGKYRVRAWVDAQNAFGATIRSHFVCELEYVGNDSWQLISLDFD